MADRLRDLVLRITADSRQLTAELSKVESGSARTTKRIESQWRQISSGITGAFSKLKGLPLIGAATAAVGGAASIAGLTALADEAREAADQVDKLAGKLGLSTTALQQYQFAANLAGIEQGEFDAAMRAFARNVGQAAIGTGEAKSSLQALGVSLRDSEGRARSLEDVFEDVIRALSRVKDASVASALAQKVFAEGGAGFVNLARDFDALIKRAEDLGIALDQEVIDAMVRAKDEATALDAVMGQRLSSSMSKVTTVGNYLKEEFVELVESMARAVDESELLSRALLSLTRPEEIRNLEDVNSRIQTTTERIADLQSQLINFERVNRGQPLAALENASRTLVAKLDEARDDLARLERRREQLLGPGAAPSGPTIDIRELPKDDSEARRKQELREITAAQGRLKTVIEASFTPAERLQAALDQLGEDYRKGLIDAEGFAKGQESIVRQFDALEEKIDSTALKEVESIIEAGKSQAEKLVEQLDRVGQLYRDGTIDAQTFAAAQESVAKQLGEIDSDPMKKAFQDLESIGKGVFEGLTGAIADFVQTGTLNLQSFAQSFARELLQLGIKVGAVGLFKGAGIDIAGALASGGPVLPGRPYLVGEKGPELVVPKQAGYVLPSVSRGAPAGTAPFAMSGGAPVYVTVNNSSRSDVDVQQRNGPSGQREIEILVTDVIARDVGRGGPVGRAIDKRLGVRPRGV